MFNPLALPRPVEEIEVRTFTDPRQPGAELTLTAISTADYTRKMKAQELNEGYINEFIGEGKFRLIVAGKKVEVTLHLCSVIASVVSMLVDVPTIEVPDKDGNPKSQPWDFKCWVALAVNMPDAFDEMVTWVNALVQKSKVSASGDPEVPNGFAGSSD